MERTMKYTKLLCVAATGFMGVMAVGMRAQAASTVQIGDSGKTYADSVVTCAFDESTGELAPAVEAGLFNPKRNASASVLLNGVQLATVTEADPAATVWLDVNATNNTVVVALNKKTADSYSFSVSSDTCALPDTAGNTLSADGTLEYGASGKSYATWEPGCAWNPATGLAEPYVHLFDNGNYVLNVSLNGVALTQLSASRPHTPVFLAPGQNVISVAAGYLSTDYYVRDGGDGSCVLQ